MTGSNLLFKQIQIIEPGKGISAPTDLLIKDGKIAAIAKDLPSGDSTEVVWLQEGYVTGGWLDVGVFAGEPGFEHREDFGSVAAAAAAGGFTAIACLPNTKPALHSKSEISFVLRQSISSAAALYPIGAISQDCAGKDLAELYDMYQAGAVAFSDGLTPVQDAGLLLRALQYATAFGGIIINHPHHKGIAGAGQMHEGRISTELGLRGLPSLAEHLMLQRDLSLLEYAGEAARLHVHLISSAESVGLLRAAKAKGLSVTASAAIANLCWTEDDMAMAPGASPFDSNLKMLPPLRGAADREALVEGVVDGTIDFISTHHLPWDVEAKNLEFPYAEFGITGLETAWSMYCMYLADKVSLERWIAAVSVVPRHLFGLELPPIMVGNVANLTIVDCGGTWEYTRSLSKSNNSPLLGKTLKGRVWGTVFNR